MTIDFKQLWETTVVDPIRQFELDYVCDHILEFKHRYELVAKRLNVPYYFVAALHYREASLSFSGVLHNGEKIIGTGQVTKLVPKGRGPFKTWEDSAIDALEPFAKMLVDPNPHNCLMFSEIFNGLGYRKKIGDTGVIELTPYVWAGTNHHDETGKVIKDGKYSPTANDKQLGIAAIYKGLKVS